MNLIQYLPISYTVESRLKSLKEIVSWIYLFPFYGLLVCYVFNENFQLATYALVLLCVVSVYEIGYLFNDLKSSAKEINPTLRVESLWYEENFWALVGARCVSCFVSILIIYVNGSTRDFTALVLSLFTLAFAFYLHNKLRGRINTFTFSFLSLVKYSALLCLVGDPFVVLFTFFSFSFLRTIEYSAIKKHFWVFSTLRIEQFDVFRVKYYVVASLVLFGVCFLASLNYLYMLIPLYFFIYRVLILLAGKKIRNQ